MSQGTSHLQENGDSSTRTVPLDKPLYHCSLCGKIEHQESFFYRRARKMRRACASRPLIHSPSHGTNTCDPKKAQFVDGFYDTISNELDHACGPQHVSRDVRVDLLLRP
jgi:hypothetical protein